MTIMSTKVPATKILAIIVSGAIIIPNVAIAESNDAKYCAALAEKYDTYIDTSGNTGGRPTPTNIARAEEKCATDPATSIPILEKVLKDARFSLPPRN